MHDQRLLLFGLDSFPFMRMLIIKYQFTNILLLNVTELKTYGTLSPIPVLKEMRKLEKY